MSDWRVTGCRRDGVPIIHGSHDRPPLDSGLMVLVGSVLLSVVMVIGLVSVALPPRNSPPGPYSTVQLASLMLVVLALSTSMLVSAWRTLALRKKLVRAYPVDDLIPMLGTDSETLRKAVRGAGIRPVCIVNDREFYSLSDLGDPDRLLRPSSAPSAGEEVLVRPAEAKPGSEDGTLLQPAPSEPQVHGDVV